MTRQSFLWFGAAGLAVSLLVALLSPLASPEPDGLQRVALDLGFAERAQEAFFKIIPYYQFPGVENAAIAKVVAGLLGVATVFGVALGLGYLLRERGNAGRGSDP